MNTLLKRVAITAKETIYGLFKIVLGSIFFIGFIEFISSHPIVFISCIAVVAFGLRVIYRDKP